MQAMQTDAGRDTRAAAAVIQGWMCFQGGEHGAHGERVAHFFRNRQALCRKWVLFGRQDNLLSDEDRAKAGVFPCCQECARRRAGEQRAGKA